MGEEIAKTIELLNEGIASLPELGTEAWNLLAQGKQFASIVDLIVIVLVFGLLVFVFSKLNNKHKSVKAEYNEYKKNYDDYGSPDSFYYWERHNVTFDYDHLELAMVLVGVAIGVYIITLFFMLPGTLKGIFMPEYQIFQNLLYSLG